ncbi:unnamed protein product [Calypogeia fissa]
MSKRKRAVSESEYRGSQSENASEEGEEETTSKPRRVMDEVSRSLVKTKRKKRKKPEVVNMNSDLGLWAASLKGPHLDLMVSLKQLAEVRLRNTGEESLASCLTPASLRTIGIILEELIKDRMITECLPGDECLGKGNGADEVQKHGEGSSGRAGSGGEDAGAR